MLVTNAIGDSDIYIKVMFYFEFNILLTNYLLPHCHTATSTSSTTFPLYVVDSSSSSSR